MLTADDHIAIHRLIALYGHIIDERQYSRIGEIFAQDAVYDVRKRDAGLHRGLDAIRALWEAAGERHPLAHHATNVVLDERSDGTVQVLSKGICVRPDGSVHSTTYRQVAAATPAGWRLTHLEAEMRSPQMIPAIS